MNTSRKYGQEDKPLPVRVATDPAMAADIVAEALATLAAAAKASRLDFDWRAHEAACKELVEVLRAPRDDVRDAAVSAHDEILAACVHGAQGLRKLTASAAMELMLVLIGVTGCTMKIKNVDLIVQTLTLRAAEVVKSESDVWPKQLADAILTKMTLLCAPRPIIKALASQMATANKRMREKLAAHLDEAVVVHALMPAVAAEAAAIFTAAATVIEDANPAARLHGRRIFATLRHVVEPRRLNTLAAKIHRPSTATSVRAAIDAASVPPFPRELAAAHETSVAADGMADEYLAFLEARESDAADAGSETRAAAKINTGNKAAVRARSTQPNVAPAAPKAAGSAKMQPTITTSGGTRGRVKDAFAHVPSKVKGWMRRCSARRSNKVAPAPAAPPARSPPQADIAEPKAVAREEPKAVERDAATAPRGPLFAAAWPARAMAEAAGTKIPRVPRRG